MNISNTLFFNLSDFWKLVFLDSHWSVMTSAFRLHYSTTYSSLIMQKSQTKYEAYNVQITLDRRATLLDNTVHRKLD